MKARHAAAAAAPPSPRRRPERPLAGTATRVAGRCGAAAAGLCAWKPASDGVLCWIAVAWRGGLRSLRPSRREHGRPAGAEATIGPRAALAAVAATLAFCYHRRRARRVRVRACACACVGPGALRRASESCLGAKAGPPPPSRRAGVPLKGRTSRPGPAEMNGVRASARAGSRGLAPGAAPAAVAFRAGRVAD